MNSDEQRPDEPFEIELEIESAPPTAAIAPTAEVLAPIEVAALRADSVSYARTGRSILDRVSLVARPGQATAVVGPSGSGKSSLLAILAGLEAPDSGTVSRPTGRPGIVLQAYGLAGLLSAAENVEMALQGGALGSLSPSRIRAASAAALAGVGLGEQADHLVEELSGGQQQRVAIARALVTDPQVMIADEFTTELDHDTKQHALELILAIARRGGVVVIATHDGEIAARCDQIVTLVDGRVAPGA
jgi:ABC-type lipoprotein export system ATPase subunit